MPTDDDNIHWLLRLANRTGRTTAIVCDPSLFIGHRPEPVILPRPVAINQASSSVYCLPILHGKDYFLPVGDPFPQIEHLGRRMHVMAGIAGAPLLTLPDMDKVKILFSVSESGEHCLLFEKHFRAVAIEAEGRGSEIEFSIGIS